jgi:hypothetical protein
MLAEREKIYLKAIRQRNYSLAVFTGLGIIISVLILACGMFMPESQTHMLLTVSVSATGCTAGLWLREYRKLKTARLIVENQILHIRPAVISDSAGDAEKPEDAENIEMFVSYFGILLGTKIIKFNQDGIRLKAVEIGRDFISLAYGTDKRMQNTRLLRAAIDNGELEKIVERFRFETGIVPVIIN